MADGIAAQAPRTAGELTLQQMRWARLAIFTALAMASLDTAIANVALPTIAAELNATPADVIWVVNVYQIAMVATLLPLGALGEIIGHQRIYLGGLVLFTLASVGCAFAWSLDSLLIARVLQGLGGAGAMSVNAALVRIVYPPSQFGRGLGTNALVVASSFTLGPTIASAILSVASWQWLFAINLPFGLAALAISLKTLPTTSRAAHSFDVFGALLTALSLGLLILGIDSLAHNTSLPIVATELAGGLLFGWLLLRRQADHPAPMLPIDLFRRPLFALSAATAVCAFTVQGLGFVSLPFYFEEVLHRSAVETGFFLTPWPLVVGIMAPIAGRLSDRYPAGILGGIGLVMLGIGMVLLATLPAEPSIGNIVWRMVICGAGFGFFQAPNIKAIMSSAPAGRSGGASGIVATARLTGQSTGAALAASCFALFGHAGATWALALGAVFAAIGCVMSFLRLVVNHPTD
jgi:DHA2 family multidrug resistance protein-like MFS transporter